jgi:prepilin-type N-terminal cleavage/methylation domain-containing protein
MLAIVPPSSSLDSDAHMRVTENKGFTVIELSIVLVIIGLILGGILVGAELINAAKVRAQMSQIEKFQTAINTFMTKYNGLPGDLNAEEAAKFGFITRDGTLGHGDGNGFVEIPVGNYPQAGEPLLFWSDLGMAGLIEGNFSSAVDLGVDVTTFTDTLIYFPRAKVVDDASVFATSHTSNLWFVIAQFMYDGICRYSAKVPPKNGYAVDYKMDDGRPLNGRVVVGQGICLPSPLVFFLSPNQSDTDCVDNSNQYNFRADAGNCQMNFRAR